MDGGQDPRDRPRRPAEPGRPAEAGSRDVRRPASAADAPPRPRTTPTGPRAALPRPAASRDRADPPEATTPPRTPTRRPLPDAAPPARTAERPTRPVPVARSSDPASRPRDMAPQQSPAPGNPSRPRRLATRTADESAAAATPSPAEPAPEPQRRRSIKSTLRARRSALPAEAEPVPPKGRDAEPARLPPRPAQRPVSPTPQTMDVQGFDDLETPDAESDFDPDAPIPGAIHPKQRSTGAPRERTGEARPRTPGSAPRPRHQPKDVVDAPDEHAIVENGPIVDPRSVAGRGLTAVIAIMTFVCALLFGAAVLIEEAAEVWAGEVRQDISVTILPLDGDPVERRVERAAQILRTTPGLDDVDALSAGEAEALLSPWLGSDADFSLLPIPRLVTANRTGPLDGDALRSALAAVPGTSLDDHRDWSARLEGMAATVSAGAIGALVLMLVATVLSIVFATRAAIATNAGTVEVLSMLGADDRFIQRAFRGRFLRIGVRGAGIGLAAALILFGALEAWSMLSSGATSDQSRALFGAPGIGPFGFAGLFVLGLVVALLVIGTARAAVRHHLDRLSV
ncbi:hypothetical protein RDV64_02270 [Acuticoccus sp. MNP-M23]|uniref:cell division protein FtsX n=1 Tax=Acuticoccus sp. MNP-M23 TaxID=3072793 RepID=UPI00281536EC|nr:FtsX-like permease family protein [Acuticoccus sp. MNP-M23]WMS43249.1 hypothetical protein RDV64_02270 [Acuticoccus sp. MNP-M23]